MLISSIIVVVYDLKCKKPNFRPKFAKKPSDAGKRVNVVTVFCLYFLREIVRDRSACERVTRVQDVGEFELEVIDNKISGLRETFSR